MERQMKPPPGLLGATLLFWGWQTQYFVVGVVMAVILESASFIRARWEFAEEDFKRVWTLCTLLLLTATVYSFTANESASDLFGFLQNPNFFTQRRAGNSSARAVASLMQWQPMIFFPFIAGATFSVREGIPLRTISLILQKRWKRAKKLGQSLPASPVVHIGYAYFVLCLFCSSIQSNEDMSFFWGLCALVVWALWPHRSKRFSLAAYASVLLAAVTLGYYGQRAVGDVQQYLVSLNPQWFAGYSRRGFDPREAKTVIGRLGRVKLSSTIVIRVETQEASRAPALLREASYRTFRDQWWSSGTTARTNEFETMPSETNQTSFIMLPDKPASQAVKIAAYLPGGVGLLPLPRGTTRLGQLPAFLMQTNRLGAVLAEGPGLVIFEARYGPGATIDSPPESVDTVGVPKREVPALERIITEANLRGRSLEDAMRLLNQYFQNCFTYSTWQPGRAFSLTNHTPLSAFLLISRSGHCEYFASATVLLLRQLGFPARYAVGYAVHEKSGDAKYVVRQRDAHAWCLVWHNGRWQDFDTTPATWFEAEAQRASAFQAVSDFFSRLGFEFSRIRWGQSHLRTYLLWSLGPALALLLLQIIFRSARQRRSTRENQKKPPPIWPGLDSDFYEIERSLKKHGLGRQPAEAWSNWLTRVTGDRRLAGARELLREVSRLHDRYRFDPRGLEASERGALRTSARECLQGLKACLNRH